MSFLQVFERPNFCCPANLCSHMGEVDHAYRSAKWSVKLKYEMKSPFHTHLKVKQPATSNRGHVLH